jgi:hypothetical protein
LKGEALELKPFQKDEIRSILADFEATDLKAERSRTEERRI